MGQWGGKVITLVGQWVGKRRRDGIVGKLDWQGDGWTVGVMRSDMQQRKEGHAQATARFARGDALAICTY